MLPTWTFEPSDRRIDARHFPGSRSKTFIWKHLRSFERISVGSPRLSPPSISSGSMDAAERIIM